MRHVCVHALTVAATEEYIDALVGMSNAVPPQTAEAACAVFHGKQAQEDGAVTVHKGTRRLVLADMRMLYNSLDRTAAALREAGYEVEMERSEKRGTVEVWVRIGCGEMKG